MRQVAGRLMARMGLLAVGPRLRRSPSSGERRRKRPLLESLEGRRVPTGGFVGVIDPIVTGAGAGGGPEVRGFSSTGSPLTNVDFLAYNPSFGGGVNVAVGDVNGDGKSDVVTGAGPGGGPQVNVYNGADGSLIESFFAYDPSFRGGVNVAVGDFFGDGRQEIVTAAGPGGGPDVRVFSGTTSALLTEFFAYDPGFTGGVSVAAGDVDGVGRDEIITGAGPGGGPDVRVFAVSPGVVPKREFFAYSPGFRGGVSVAAGDVDGDGHIDVITGAGPGGGPQVNVFSGPDGSLIRSFFAYDPGFRGGADVTSEDVDGDGRADVITGAGPGGGPEVRAFSGQTGAVLDDFFAYNPGFSGGVHVATRRSPPRKHPASASGTPPASFDSSALSGAAPSAPENAPGAAVDSTDPRLIGGGSIATGSGTPSEVADPAPMGRTIARSRFAIREDRGPRANRQSPRNRLDRF